MTADQESTHEGRASLDRFRLPFAAGDAETSAAVVEGNSPALGGGWSCEGLYISHVVVAAHLVLTGTSASEAKDPLLSHLRMLGFLATDHGYLRPIVCVAEVGEEQRGKVASWGWDQNWHRGEFLLFVATSRNEAEELLGGLLERCPELWGGEAIYQPQHVDELKGRLEGLPVDSLRKAIEGAVEAAHAAIRSPGGAPNSEREDGGRHWAGHDPMKRELESWYEAIERRAQEAFEDHPEDA